MPDLAHTDTIGWIAMAMLLIIAAAWYPVVRELPSTLLLLAQLTIERWQRRDEEPIAFDADRFASGIGEDTARRYERAARGSVHAERAKVRRDEALGRRAS